MKKSYVVSLALLLPLAAVLAGCGHLVTIADFVGTWTATTWTETNLASPYQTEDVIALGGSWTITIAADGSYTGTVVMPPPAASVPVSGTSTILSNSSMVVHQGASTFNITYTLSGNTWTLTHTDGTYGFGGGAAVPSRQEITAIRG